MSGSLRNEKAGFAEAFTMWKYKEISRKDFETRKDFIEGILRELGASTTNLGYSHRVSYYGREVSAWAARIGRKE